MESNSTKNKTALAEISATKNLSPSFPLAKKLVIVEKRKLHADLLRNHIIREPLFQEVYSTGALEEIKKLADPNEPAVFLVSGNFYPFLIRAIREIYRFHPEAIVVVLDERTRSGLHLLLRSVKIHGYWTNYDSLSQILFGLHETIRGRESLSPQIVKSVEYYENGLKSSSRLNLLPLLLLTNRELELFLLIGQGTIMQACAHEMNIAFRTAVNLREKLMKKLGVRSHTEIFWKAMEYGLIDIAVE